MATKFAVTVIHPELNKRVYIGSARGVKLFDERYLGMRFIDEHELKNSTFKGQVQLEPFNLKPKNWFDVESSETFDFDDYSLLEFFNELLCFPEIEINASGTIRTNVLDSHIKCSNNPEFSKLLTNWQNGYYDEMPLSALCEIEWLLAQERDKDNPVQLKANAFNPWGDFELNGYVAKYSKENKTWQVWNQQMLVTDFNRRKQAREFMEMQKNAQIRAIQ